MTLQEVRAGSQGAASSERARVIVLASLVIGAIALYVTFRASSDVGNSQKDLLPFQTLARTLPESEQTLFHTLRQGLLQVEAERARLSRWPEPAALASAEVAPFAGGSGYTWQLFRQGMVVSYLGLPADAASPAWMLTIQEPEPNSPPDRSPNDEEHHRLPDGTTLHIYVWRHQFGGRVSAAFIPQPQADGWTQVYSVPPNPVLPTRPS